jgi:hypothetical protein
MKQVLVVHRKIFCNNDLDRMAGNGTISRWGVGSEFFVDNSLRNVCDRGCDPSIGPDGVSPMPTIPQRIASAFAVLCGRYGDVTELANDREQSRQSLDREA